MTTFSILRRALRDFEKRRGETCTFESASLFSPLTIALPVYLIDKVSKSDQMTAVTFFILVDDFLTNGYCAVFLCSR